MGFMHKKSLLPRTVHALVGWIALCLLILQGFVGSQKMLHVDNKSVFNKTFRWHGDSGLLVWDLLCLSIVEIAVIGCWWLVHVQLKRKGTDGDSQSGDGEE